ncbi:hypothetical protein EZV73_00325 [Acidaminobacter sp. JC074]|uniref:DUF6036 family nucleotidyltransferase n=1 Tax=Acidaminobacter sp. JC074 TaxID=2530199 RepID=UPI001F104282|nr:DUF6036 family nucleotidyltransferase [Acidaminobacter sp. JC074]MCH4885984.1 hypothetical protein [Acidaminobacter sp. JC074]
MKDIEEVIDRLEGADKVFNLLFPGEKLILYLAGGLACLFTDASVRPTMDFDFIETDFNTKYIRALNILGDYDLVDTSISAIAKDYENRAKVIFSGMGLKVFSLSAEDIIVMKLNRYSNIDKEDIKKLLGVSDKDLLDALLLEATEHLTNPYSKSMYLENVSKFRKEVLHVQ